MAGQNGLTAKIDKGVLTITIPVDDPPRPSASGKSLVVASTRGNVQTDLLVNGRPVTIGLNVYTQNK